MVPKINMSCPRALVSATQAPTLYFVDDDQIITQTALATDYLPILIITRPLNTYASVDKFDLTVSCSKLLLV